MGLLANFKIRTKIIIALLPLAIMVIIATLYSSDRMSRIDARYSALLDHDVKALHELTLAQAHNNKFGSMQRECSWQESDFSIGCWRRSFMSHPS